MNGRSPIDINLSVASNYDALVHQIRSLSNADKRRHYGSVETAEAYLKRYEFERDRLMRDAEKMEQEFGLAGLGDPADHHAEQQYVDPKSLSGFNGIEEQHAVTRDTLTRDFKKSYITAQLALKHGECSSATKHLVEAAARLGEAAANAAWTDEGESRVQPEINQLAKLTVSFRKKCLRKK